MSELIGLASQPITSEFIYHVHSRNILRALFRDSTLGEKIQPFISSGLQISIDGYNSKFWPVSNSSAMLFSVLVRRIFGVGKSKACSQSRNLGMSGRAFFSRYPELFEYFLRQLSTYENEKQNDPGTFMVLIILSNLSPSAGENSKSTINVESLVPHVIRCSENPATKIRNMAARAVSSLVSKEQIGYFIISLLKDLVSHVESGMLKQNYIHGCCLQIHHLVKASEVSLSLSSSSNNETKEFFYPTVFESLWKAKALLSDFNPCLATRLAFGMVVENLLFTFLKSPDENIKRQIHGISILLKFQFRFIVLKEKNSSSAKGGEKDDDDDDDDDDIKMLNVLMKSEERVLFFNECVRVDTCHHHPFFHQYVSFLARCNLKLILSQGIEKVSLFESIIVKLLNSTETDVQLETLKVLNSLALKSQAAANLAAGAFNDAGMTSGRDCEDSDEDEESDGDVDLTFCDFSNKKVDDSDTNFSMSTYVQFITREIVRSACNLAATENIFHLNVQQVLVFLTNVMKLECSNKLKVFSFHECLDMFHHAVNLISSCTFIETQVRAFYLAAESCFFLFNVVGNRNQKKSSKDEECLRVLERFCIEISRVALSENSTDDLKLSSCYAITLNSDVMLVDTEKNIGCMVYKNWTSLVLLSQEEDLNIREMSVSCVPRLCSIVGRPFSMELNPTYGLEVLLDIFFHLHCYRGEIWSKEGLQVVCKWLLEDPLNQENVQDIRLFDRGQLNPFRDEIRFVIALYEIVQRLLRSTYRSSGMMTFNPQHDMENRLCNVSSPSRKTVVMCPKCETDKCWECKESLKEWSEILKKDVKRIALLLKNLSTIEIFTRQSTLQKSIIEFVRKICTVTFIENFVTETVPQEDENDGTDGCGKFMKTLLGNDGNSSNLNRNLLTHVLEFTGLKWL